MNKPKKKSVTKKSVYAIFVLSYVSILLLALSSSALYAFRINQQVSKQTQLSKQALLSSLQSKVEDSVSYIQELSNALVFNSKIEHFMRGSVGYTAPEIMRELSAKQKPRSLLFDYFLYQAETDEIITSTIRMKANLFFDIMYSFKNISYEDLHAQYFKQYNFRRFFPVQEMNAYDESTVMVLPYIQSVPMNNTEQALGQVVFFIDAEQLFAQVEQIHNATSSDVYLFDNNDVLIMSSQNARALDDEVLQNREPFKVVNKEVVTCKISAQTGWRYIITTKNSVYYQDNVQTLLNLIPIFALYLVGGLFLVHKFAQRSYRPVLDIKNIIAGKSAEASVEENEFDAIRRTLLAQMKNDTQLRDTIDSLRPAVLRDSLIHMLIGQTVDNAAAQKQLASLGVHCESDNFLVVIVQIETDSAFFLHKGENADGDDISLARVIVTNVGSELFGNEFMCSYVDLGQNQNVFILNLRENIVVKGADIKAKNIASQLVSFSADTFELNISVGISIARVGLESLSFCLDDARKALDYSRMQNDGEPMLYCDVQNVKFDYYYPPEAEHHLLTHLKAGNVAQAKQVLCHVLDANNSKKIGTVAAKSILYEITATLQRAAHTHCVFSPQDQAFLLFDEAAVALVVESTSLEQARGRLFTLIEQLCAAIESYSPGKTERLAHSVADYIDANADTSWLDLNGLSEKFGVTPQYISNMFKKYKNENVKDYIAKAKLRCAKHLLETTDLPVRDIAAQLGYAGEISVIRLMRRYEGVTPGDYRLACRRANDDKNS